MELLEDRYVTNLPGKVTFGVSSQHYTFTENAFVEFSVCSCCNCCSAADSLHSEHLPVPDLWTTEMLSQTLLTLTSSFIFL